MKNTLLTQTGLFGLNLVKGRTAGKPAATDPARMISLMGREKYNKMMLQKKQSEARNP